MKSFFKNLHYGKIIIRIKYLVITLSPIELIIIFLSIVLLSIYLWMNLYLS